MEAAKQLVAKGSVQLEKVRATLFKFQFSLQPRESGYPNCAGIFQTLFRAGFEGSEFIH
jgi:hypothetical protein